MKTITLEATELTLRLARVAVGASEVPTGSNKGPFVRRCLRAAGLPEGLPWCVGFVQLVGRTALGAAWPLPVTGGCAVVGDWAKRRGVLEDEPAPGDLFLLWLLVKDKEHPAGLWRFAHVGFIDGPKEPEGWPTIEGNTSGEGSREGWIVAARHRNFAPADKFVRWIDLFAE